MDWPDVALAGAGRDCRGISNREASMTATARLSEDVQQTVLYRMWWAIFLKGALFVAFAFGIYFWQGRSLPGAILLFAGFAVSDGLVTMLAAVRGGGLSARAGLALAGLTSILAGALALWPE